MDVLPVDLLRTLPLLSDLLPHSAKGPGAAPGLSRPVHGCSPWQCCCNRPPAWTRQACAIGSTAAPMAVRHPGEHALSITVRCLHLQPGPSNQHVPAMTGQACRRAMQLCCCVQSCWPRRELSGTSPLKGVCSLACRVMACLALLLLVQAQQQLFTPARPDRGHVLLAGGQRHLLGTADLGGHLQKGRPQWVM